MTILQFFIGLLFLFCPITAMAQGLSMAVLTTELSKQVGTVRIDSGQGQEIDGTDDLGLSKKTTQVKQKAQVGLWTNVGLQYEFRGQTTEKGEQKEKDPTKKWDPSTVGLPICDPGPFTSKLSLQTHTLAICVGPYESGSGRFTPTVRISHTQTELSVGEKDPLKSQSLMVGASLRFSFQLTQSVALDMDIGNLSSRHASSTTFAVQVSAQQLPARVGVGYGVETQKLPIADMTLRSTQQGPLVNASVEF
jgi:hypothetical protein